MRRVPRYAESKVTDEDAMKCRSALLLMMSGILIGCGGEERQPADPFVAPDRNNANTNAQTPDPMPSNNGNPGAEDAGMTELDAGMTEPDAEPDPGNSTFGEVCPYDTFYTFDGACDPINGTGCPSDQVCRVIVQVVGPDANATTACREPAPDAVPAGSACGDGVTRCEAGTACISFFDECRTLCFPDDAEGCQPGEYCRRPSDNWVGLGFCDVDCNL